MLDPTTTDELRAVLTSLRTDLIAYRSITREGAKPVVLDQPIGRLTRIDAIQQQKLTQANRRRNEVRLQQVEAALRRMDAGRYGECALCEGEIKLERLRARPEAPVCLDCQQEMEQQA